MKRYIRSDSDLTHIWEVGQHVRYLADDGFFGTTWHSGTVSEVYPNKVIVDIPDISNHVAFYKGVNLDSLYPEYNF